MSRLFDFRLLSRILGLARPFRKQFIGAMVLAVLLALLTVLSPALIGITIDRFVMAGDRRMLYVMTSVMLAAILLQSGLSYVFTYLSGWLGQNIILRLRHNVFSRLVTANIGFFDRTPVGTTTTRTINDVETVNDIFAEGIITIVADLLTIVAVISFMLYTSWQLTLATLVVMPILLVAAYFFKEGIRKSFTDVRNQVARLNAFLQEHITGMHIVQLFNAGDKEFGKFKAINAAHRDANVRSIFYYSVFFPVVEIISSLALGTLLWYWAHGYIDGATSLGQLNAFILCINLLFRTIRMLA
ncbi:MAG TPA: ABC transporter ATP-binding protein, partial [Chitinophagales bacterium]|nr:ABC transporter ATP-binding protein [Chitinophagales bacterium]